MSKHLIVVSIDAMVFEDIEYVKEMPNFKRLLDGAAIIQRVRTIYPSVTHPVHATILTGSPAGVTGVVNNVVFDAKAPDKSERWYSELHQIKCDTLLHAAKRAGLSTASSTWPLVSRAESVVDYLVPSALNYYFEGREDDPLSVYRELGASEEMMKIIEEGVKLYGYRDEHPEATDFQFYCAAEIIKKYKPSLLLMHPGDVDHVRHLTGVFSDEVNKSLERCDAWLGKLFAAIDEAGITDETDVIVMSDHGQINITRVVSPNVWLADKGYIRLEPDGSIKDWDVYAMSTGASAQVYLSRPDDEKLTSEVYELLSEMASEGIYGFERVYTADEMRERYGLYGDFSFVLETDGYSSFGPRVTRPAVTGYDFDDYRYSKGTHGHEPHKGPQPTFIAKGPSFKQGAVVECGSILNHAPTIARILGLELRDAWGSPEEKILNL